MSPRLLLISADPTRAGELRDDLVRLGCEVALLSPEDLDEQAEDLHPPHVVVLDLSGRARDGAGRAERIRATEPLRDRPLLAVIGEADLEAFEWRGEIDDVIVAPWHRGELAVRVRRALARVDGSLSGNALRCGELAVDPDRYEVTVGGARTDLTLKEYELLKHLMSNPGRVFTRDQLLSTIWGYEYFGGTRTVDVHIRRLRAKLGDIGERCIDTVRGVGYVFRP